MGNEELKEILRLHRLWILGDPTGKRANLSEANLTGADLSGANLTEANLTEANLSWADLSWANLSEANLTGADLSGANLTGANLTEANLSWASLSWANLSWANLSWAKLSRADLSWANLSEANLSEANLKIIKADFIAALCCLPSEVAFLRAAIVAGKIDGSTYDGECACLAGTFAHAKGCKVEELGTLQAEAGSPRERWFLAIRPGDTPDKSQVAAITLGWIDEWFSLMRQAAKLGTFAEPIISQQQLLEST